MNLIPGDLGRPIAHIKPNIRCSNLEELIADAIQTVSVQEREVTDLQGNLYALRIRPYKSVDSRIDGAVLTLIDLSTSKVGRKLSEAIFDDAIEPIVLLDERLRVVRTNVALQKMFGVSAGEAELRVLDILGREHQHDLTHTLNEIVSDAHTERRARTRRDRDGRGAAIQASDQADRIRRWRRDPTIDYDSWSAGGAAQCLAHDRRRSIAEGQHRPDDRAGLVDTGRAGSSSSTTRPSLTRWPMIKASSGP